MNLDSLTPDQRACVEHVDGPLLVSAGAGSGKTFMLTQRIAYALLNPDKSGVADIDQVLAITFTDLAASEIKARVRNKLREEGLADQALKVDACWISTIHGMCSRILHENALDLGLDPQFGLLDDTDRDRLLDDCIDQALREDGEDDPYPALFAEYETSRGASAVREMVAAVVNAAANVRDGMEALRWADPASPHELACEMLDAMRLCNGTAREGIGINGKAKETFTVNARAALEDPACGMAAFERLAAKGDCSYPDIVQALARIDLSFGSRTSKEPYATAYAALRQTYVKVGKGALAGVALPAQRDLLTLARRVQQLFDRAKLRMGKLDQNDLLLKTLHALDTVPSVRARYADRFKLVMVDEFQDTSGLQIALIGHLTDHDRHLCTVGDTQQSIYRFRGADVDTYRRHKEHMRSLESCGGMYRELGKNFRSHGDVIAFVNRIFGADDVFGRGGEFIELAWDEGHAAKNPFPDVARIRILVTTYGHRCGVKTHDAHLVEAEAIAREFEDLHADAPNRRWGDMVILLGTTSRADTYAATLRAHGIPCIVTGGSGFTQTPEACEVCALLGAVANPWDDAAMLKALTGSAFGLGGDELLEVATAKNGTRRHLWKGLLELAGTSAFPRTRLAGTLLARAVEQAGARPVEDTLADLLVESGWLARLQEDGPQGMARAANALKAVRLAASIEHDPDAARGVASTAERMALKFETGLKEKPGALMTEGQDAVRILTIHASKGLEFPIVALADFYGTRANSDNLLLETVGDRIFMALKPRASVAEKTPGAAVAKIGLSAAQKARLEAAGLSPEPIELGEVEDGAGRGGAVASVDACELLAAIAAHAQAEELGELRRKFYVGATRPREALIVAVNTPVAKEPSYGDVVDDLRRGTVGPCADFATAPEGLDFGGSSRAQMRRIDLTFGEDGLAVDGTPAAQYLRPELFDAANGEPGGETSGGAPRRESIPRAPGDGEGLFDSMPRLEPCRPSQSEPFSYSAIAASCAGGRTSPEHADTNGPANAGEGEPRAEGGETAPGTPDDPAAFGSAFHQLCQLSAERLRSLRRHTQNPAAGRLEEPPGQLAAATMRTWNIRPHDERGLREAFARWLASDDADVAQRHAVLEAEAPFFVTLAGRRGETLYLEGSIDLLCHGPGEPSGQTAFVVDYKTGGSPDETPVALRDKHELQAACYAYAVLWQGYDAVELSFVRVQQTDPARPDQPQTVRYRFAQTDLERLAERIRAAHRRAAT